MSNRMDVYEMIDALAALSDEDGLADADAAQAQAARRKIAARMEHAAHHTDHDEARFMEWEAGR